MTQLTSDADRATGRSSVLPIVAVGVLLTAIDLFIVNVAVPDIAADFEVTELSDLSWVLNAYTIALAALLVPAGRIGDRVGNKPAFLTGMLVFVAASVLCAAAPDLTYLVGFRILQALGAAIMIPSSLGLVLATTPTERRATAVRLWVALGGLGATLGPVVGGLLVEVSWRWVFLVNVPIGLVAILVGWRLLPNPAPDSGRRLDLLGTLLLVASVSTLVAALVNAEAWGWTSAETLGIFGASAVAALLFAVTVIRFAEPVVDIALLRVPNFTLMTVQSVLFNAAFGAMLLSVVLWLQQIWGWSAIKSGLAIAPGPFIVLPVAVLAGRLIARAGPGPVMALGGLFYAAGLSWWALFAEVEPNYLNGVLVGMLLTGIGVGLALPPAFAVGTAELPTQRFATGSAVLGMARQIGLALGVAVLVAVLGTYATPEAALDSFRHGWWVTCALSLAAGAVALGTNTDSPAHTKDA